MLKEELIASFEQIVGKNNTLTQKDEIFHYGHDETETIQYNPELVLKPASAQQIANIMAICHQHQIPVTPRGAGTGLCGGAIPHKGGVVISMEKLNKIIAIDEKNLQVITEPGVITEVLQNAVKEKGLFYPPDPSSKGSCFIGGNIAENSGGPKAVKYGVVKDYVLNLEVVLPNGTIIETGASVLKNSTGYNLTQLIVGSEGTLDIVTKITLKLIPLPKYDVLMLASFNNLQKDSEAVRAIFRAGYTPSALELVEIDALKIVSNMLDSHAIPIHGNTAAHLIIELDGNNKDLLMQEMEAIAGLLENSEVGDLYFAEDEAQKNELWKLRRRVAEAVKLAGYTIEEDTVVPRAYLPELIKGVKELARQHGFEAVCYGHAGDGNLHIRIKDPRTTTSYNAPHMQQALGVLFKLVKQLGGTISGEHGIGLIQKKYMPLVMQEANLQIMRSIKKAFDPNNILNAGKIFDMQ
jgi:glycolate oxidase